MKEKLSNWLYRSSIIDFQEGNENILYIFVFSISLLFFSEGFFIVGVISTFFGHFITISYRNWGFENYRRAIFNTISPKITEIKFSQMTGEEKIIMNIS